MSESTTLKVKSGKLRNKVFNIALVSFYLDHGSTSQFLVHVQSINESCSFKYKQLKVHVLNGDHIIQSDGLKIVLFDRDPLFDNLFDRSPDGQKAKISSVPSATSVSKPMIGSNSVRVAQPFREFTNKTQTTMTTIKSSGNVSRRTPVAPTIKSAVKNATPEKSRPISSSVAAIPTTRQEIGYESPFKLRSSLPTTMSPDGTSRSTPNTAERQRKQPDPLFPSYIIGNAGTTPLRGVHLYDTTETDQRIKSPERLDASTAPFKSNDNFFPRQSTTPLKSAVLSDPRYKRQEKTPVESETIEKPTALFASTSDPLDIFSPKPAMKQYGKRKAVTSMNDHGSDSFYARVPISPSVDNPGVAANANTSSTLNTDMKQFWQSRAHQNDSNRRVIPTFDESAEEPGQHLPPVIEQKNKVARYFEVIPNERRNGGLMSEFMHLDASTDDNSSGVSKKLRGGIRNLGNTCYMSAIMQALMASHEFMNQMESAFWSKLPQFLSLNAKELTQAENRSTEMELVASSIHPSNDDKENIADLKYTKYSVYNKLVTLAQTKRNMVDQEPVLHSAQYGSNFILNNSLDISKLKEAIVQQTHKFHGFQQHDAHEFLNSLTSTLQDEMFHYLTQYSDCIRQYANTDDNGHSVNKFDLSFISPSGVMDMKSPPASLVKASPMEKSTQSTLASPIVDCLLLPVSNCFESVVEVSSYCKKCGYQRTPRTETYRDFSIELNEGNVANSLLLNNLFNDFFANEERELNCEHCVKEDRENDNTDAALTSSEDMNSSEVETPTTVLEEDTQSIDIEKQPKDNVSDNCNKIVLSSRLVSLPDVLIIHMKRFQYRAETSSFAKNNCQVTFPLTMNESNCPILRTSADIPSRDVDESIQTIFQTDPEKLLYDSSLSKKLAALSQETVVSAVNTRHKVSNGYELYAVVRHIGTESIVGHYICDVKLDQQSSNDVDDSEFKLNWLRYNDSQVTKVTESLVLSEQDTPYIFFYKKI